MDHMIETLRDLFLAIWLEQNDAWRNDRAPNRPSSKAKEVLNEVGTRGSFANQFDQAALLNSLPSETQLDSDFKRYLLLPPSRRAADFVPLMWMKYNLAVEPVDIRIRVTMFCLEGNELEGLALRLESPENRRRNTENDNGIGMHEFYHAQLGHDDWPTKPSWIPTSQPSFPLCANCPVTLVISLLLTLYGRKETARVLANHKLHRIERYKKQLERWVKV